MPLRWSAQINQFIWTIRKDANRIVSNSTAYVDNLEKKKGKGNEVNDSQSMH
jgi:hypothetical protein